MALEVHVGTFTLNTSTGNQAVTGTGFQPKAIIFFGASAQADGIVVDNTRNFGAAVSSTSRAALNLRSHDSAATTEANHAYSNAACYYRMNDSFAVDIEVDFVSFDSDGFTVDITNAGAADLVNYIAIGGDDLTDVSLDEIQSPTSTGNQGYTGPGFQPDCILAFTAGGNQAPPTSNQNHVTGSIGFATGSGASAESCFGWGAEDVANRSDTDKGENDGVVGTTFANSFNLEADLVSFDTNGYTLNWSTVQGTARYVWILALKGGQYEVVKDTEPTTATTKQTTTSFDPVAVALNSRGSTTASGSVDNNAEALNSFGAFSSATDEACVSLYDGHNEDPTDSARAQEQDEVITFLAANSSLVDEGNASSLDTGGFTLDWTTVSGNANRFSALAFGSAAAGRTTKNTDPSHLGQRIGMSRTMRNQFGRH